MSGSHHHIRAFIAISLPKEIKEFLHDLQGQLYKAGIKASWPNPATMHLTLKFLGNIKPGKLDSIRTCMMKAVTGIPIHTLSASGIGVFPSVKNTRVIWSGTRGQIDILEKLASRLESILFEDLRIQREKRRFSSHLTVARIKQPVYPKKMIKLLQEFENSCSDDFLVSRIKLFQSKLTSTGAVHKTIFCVPFED